MIMQSIAAVCLDLDGVVYFGSQAAGGAVDAIRRLRQHGMLVRYVTNNSASHRLAIAHKLRDLGISAELDQIVSSAWASARWLRANGHRRAYLLGTSGLERELTEVDIAVEREDCGAVLPIVVGYDPRFALDDLARLLPAIVRGGALVACNREATYPVEGGQPKPGLGPIVAAVECAAGRPMDVVVGKPDPTLLALALEGTSLPPERVLMVGDSRSSDIAMANAYGCASAFVRPAVPVSSSPSRAEPTFEVDSLAELVSRLWS